jgi:hypothetical protein
MFQDMKTVPCDGRLVEVQHDALQEVALTRSIRVSRPPVIPSQSHCRKPGWSRAKGCWPPITSVRMRLPLLRRASLQWHATDVDSLANHTTAVFAPLSIGPDDGIGRKRHFAYNANVVGRASTVWIMANIISLNVHQVVGTCHWTPHAASRAAGPVERANVDGRGDCSHGHWSCSHVRRLIAHLLVASALYLAACSSSNLRKYKSSRMCAAAVSKECAMLRQIIVLMSVTLVDSICAGMMRRKLASLRATGNP